MTRSNKKTDASVSSSGDKPLTTKQSTAAAKKQAKEKVNTPNDTPVIDFSSDITSREETSSIQKKRKDKKGKANNNQQENPMNKETTDNSEPPSNTPTVQPFSTDAPDEDTSMEISPIKKKTKPTTSSKRATTTQKERQTDLNELTIAPATPARSSLKQGRYGVRPSTPAPERMHLHNHKRVIVEAAFTFDGDDRFKTLVAALASLLTFSRMVDEHFIINTVKENSRDKDWSDPTLLPTSMTALGAYCVISGTPVYSRRLEQQAPKIKTTNGIRDHKRYTSPSPSHRIWHLMKSWPESPLIGRCSVAPGLQSNHLATSILAPRL